MEITHRIAWRRDSRQGGNCTNVAIDDKTLLGTGDLVCQVGCNVTVGSMTYFCNDFSETNNWSAGQRTYERNIGKSLTYFEAS